MSIIAAHTPIIPPEREIITIYRDDENDYYCNEFGKVDGWHSADQASHQHGPSRPCIHRFEPMPSNVLFSYCWVHDLHWQLHIAHDVMAGRTADVVTMAFDVIGPILGCHNNKTNFRKPENLWHYRLYHMRWWDEDDLSERVVLGVWPD
jgi:hypothetical protein